MALVVNDGTGWLNNQLRIVYDLLDHLMPKTMATQVSNSEERNFKSIHCDIWNRYSEKVRHSLSTCSLFNKLHRERAHQRTDIQTRLKKRVQGAQTFLNAFLTFLLQLRRTLIFPGHSTRHLMISAITFTRSSKNSFQMNTSISKLSWTFSLLTTHQQRIPLRAL